MFFKDEKQKVREVNRQGCSVTKEMEERFTVAKDLTEKDLLWQNGALLCPKLFRN